MTGTDLLLFGASLQIPPTAGLREGLGALGRPAALRVFAGGVSVGVTLLKNRYLYYKVPNYVDLQNY